MAFTEKEAINWLEKVYRFSKSPDKETYLELVEEVKLEYIWCNPYKLNDEQHIRECAESVALLFDTITSENKHMIVAPKSVQRIYTEKSDGPQIETYYHDFDLSGNTGTVRHSLAAAVLHIMDLRRYRSVGICKVCKGPTFTIRPTARKTCSDKCRQKKSRNGRKPKIKED